MKKIIAITTIRSDYDLMSSLYRLLDEDEQVELKLIVAGAHLSSTYGHTVDQIESDGFSVLTKVESLLDSDSKVSRIKSASIMLLSCVDVIANYDPDLLIYAGDREDVILGGMLSGYLNIPSIHFFGGDHVIDGHVDNPVRHATSKLSSAHFVSTNEHAERLIKMGESAHRIYNIGSVAIDKFSQHTPCDSDKLSKKYEINLDKGYALIIFHPHTKEDENQLAVEQLSAIFSSLLEYTDLSIFISSPNTDPGNKKLLEVISGYSSNDRVYIYESLPRVDFLDLFKNAQFLIGNSSAGIMEAASIPIPAINVGQRQVGRLAGENVIFCHGNQDSIRDALNLVTSQKFLSSIQNMSNPYGDGNSSKKAYELIKTLEFRTMLYKTEDPLKLEKQANE